MNTQPLHRHLVAAPLFTLLLLALVAQGSIGGQIRAWANASDEGIEFPGGRILTEDGTFSVDDEGVVIVENGAALILASGPLTLTAGERSIRMLPGAVYITRSGDSLTIATITAPALVQENGSVLLLPVGVQWKGAAPLVPLSEGMTAWMNARGFSPIPAHFFEKQMAAVQRETPSLPSILPSSHSGPAMAFTSSWWQLPQAEERRKGDWYEDVLGVLRGSVEDYGWDDVLALLRDPAFAEVFASPRGQEVLVSLLDDMPEETPVVAAVTLPILSDPQLSTLLSVHPRHRSLAWSLADAPADESQELRMARLLALPYADMNGDAATSFALDRWAQDILGLPDAATVIDALVLRLAPLVTRTEELGYPERSRRLLAALTRLTDTHSPLLSRKTHDAMEMLRFYSSRRLLAAAPVEEKKVVVQEDDKPLNRFDRGIVEASAVEALKSMGALFTVNTELEATSATVIRVKSVVFSSASGDRMFDFDLHLDTTSVSTITLDGQTFPYDMTLEKFVEWASA